jgi:hypothetical protein
MTGPGWLLIRHRDHGFRSARSCASRDGGPSSGPPGSGPLPGAGLPRPRKFDRADAIPASSPPMVASRCPASASQSISPGSLPLRYCSVALSAMNNSWREFGARPLCRLKHESVEWLVLNVEANVGVDFTALEALDEVREEFARHGPIFALARLASGGSNPAGRASSGGHCASGSSAPHRFCAFLMRGAIPTTSPAGLRPHATVLSLVSRVGVLSVDRGWAQGFAGGRGGDGAPRRGATVASRRCSGCGRPRRR